MCLQALRSSPRERSAGSPCVRVASRFMRGLPFLEQFPSGSGTSQRVTGATGSERGRCQFPGELGWLRGTKRPGPECLDDRTQIRPDGR